MSEGPPGRIDRAALERIIQRAAELQTAEREIGDTLTSDELLALLEERTRVGPLAPGGLIERVAGPGQVTAQRVVPAEAEVVERQLVRWMENNELFCVQRAQPGRITWEPVGGFHAAYRRSMAAFSTGARSFMLSRASTVSAAILSLESGYSHVTLAADARGVRSGYVGGSAALITSGAAGTALMVALGAMLPLALLPLPVALGLGEGAEFRAPLGRAVIGGVITSTLLTLVAG